jgi:2-oxoisovalerate dehydrogenase E1 component
MAKKKLMFTEDEIINDYSIAYKSRQASLIGRKEVLTGKAKFGIFGDGKEVPQLIMAKVFAKGDFRSGYYRDQTFMMSLGLLSIKEFFAQLYAHTDVNADPSSAGRSMNGHFATRSLDENGKWKNLTEMYNSSADISPTASQMPRLVGLAYASKLYRNLPSSPDYNNFSKKGNEVAFGTIGNASTSEGMFFEAINAAGVLEVPMVMSIWDDEYGISVPAKYQTTKENISEVLKGFQRTKDSNGYNIYTVNGWDYEELYIVYKKAVDIARKDHIPAIIHVKELTQPQGHSTSGSHERYKSKERLAWETEYDCLTQMRRWIISTDIQKENELLKLEESLLDGVKKDRLIAWEEYRDSIDNEKNTAIQLLENLYEETSIDEIAEMTSRLSKNKAGFRRDYLKALKTSMLLSKDNSANAKDGINAFLKEQTELNFDRFNSYMYSKSDESALLINSQLPIYSDDNPMVDGREVLQACFDYWLKNDPRVFAIGEDVGKIGDVNQAFAGLQEKYGELRVTDTGIRECTIIGQGIGAAMRGLRPICEIQYLDYFLYATQIVSDDLACLQYRTKGGQKAPMIIRTRGHRLEGIWHAGSPMANILNAVHGVYLLVPRNMTQAAGFYNTILRSDEPAIIVECLNGYRLKEKLPTNIGEFTVELGIPEILKEGSDITVVSYGSTLRIIEEAMISLEKVGISCELIDVQSLIPFDRTHSIIDSIKKTGRVIFIDEDMPGGATAYMMQKVIDEQNAWQYLDSKPQCLSARENRPAYATDGDYFSKPNTEDAIEAIYNIMQEAKPNEFPAYLG